MEHTNSTHAFTVSDVVSDRTPQFTSALFRQLDFDGQRRNDIYRQLELGNTKNLSIEKILRVIEPRISRAFRSQTDLEFVTSVFLRAMLKRPQAYYTIRYITESSPTATKLLKPENLVIERGEEAWYGPTTSNEDEDAMWYVHPVLFRYSPEKIPSFDPRNGEQPGEIWYTGRWLVFARLSAKTLSLHWRGFTPNNGIIVRGNTGYESEFPYWKHIPRLIREIEGKLGIRSQDVNLQHILLHKIWDALRPQTDNYHWEDILIKADNKGIKLNAHSKKASIEDSSEDYMDIEGIRHLAQTIRKAIDRRLIQHHSFKDGLPVPEQFDEQILQTLITEFNPQSYECAIEHKSDHRTIFHSRAWISGISDQNHKESLIHLRAVNYDKYGLSSLDQLKFLLPYVSSPSKPSIQNRRLFD